MADNKINKQNKSDDEIARSTVIGGRSEDTVVLEQQDESNNESEDENSDESDDDSGFDEEYVRLVTKDGVEYLLEAPLPPTKGFILNEHGSAVIWNPNSLRMEPYVPEQVRIKKISLFHINGTDDVFRIFCLANDGSEYKQQGLAVIRTVPFSEISSWDTIVDENALIQDADLDSEGE